MDFHTARQLAQYEQTSPETLSKLATYPDKQTRQSVAANPNTPKDILILISTEFPIEVINNPVIPLLLMEDPLTFSCPCYWDKSEHYNEITLHIEKEIEKELARLGMDMMTYAALRWKLFDRGDSYTHQGALLDYLSRLQSFTVEDLLKEDFPSLKNLAEDDNTSSFILEKIAQSKDSKSCKSVAANPKTLRRTLLSLCGKFPNEVMNNPALPGLIQKTPWFFSCSYKFDFKDVKSAIDLELERLNIHKDSAREYIILIYCKRSRLHMTDAELLDFLYCLQPMTVDTIPEEYFPDPPYGEFVNSDGQVLEDIPF